MVRDDLQGLISWNIKTDDEFCAFIECGLARAKKERSYRHAARPWNTCDFSLRLESGQGDRPVCGRQGVRNIAPEGGYITDLRSRDQVTGLCQCLGMGANQRVQSDSIDCHAGA